MNASRTVCLLVEDDPLVRLVTSHALEERGYEVLCASDADQAILHLEARADIRFVVTDVEMPGSMDGLKLAAAVRNRWPPVEIIVVSGRTNVVEADLPERGVFLPKPYDHDNLVEILSKF